MSAPQRTAPGRLVLWLCAGACAAAAFWTANGVAPWDYETLGVWHQYEYLAEGFAHGHTSLSLEPAPGLLALRDPYDPKLNAPFRLWDASLYHGKYYLYQGPVPAAALMLPWRLATGSALPQRLAVAAFASAGLAGLALLIWELRRRHFPGLSAAALGFVILVAFHASWLPVTLRRSSVWELPIVSAAAFLWWALYFLWKFHDSGGRPRWAAATGVALAGLIGCRAPFVFGAGAVALLLFMPVPADGSGTARRWKAALLGAALVVAGGIALLAYNRARFGSWFEFGLGYVLFGEDYRGLRYMNPSLIPFNAWTYLFSAPSFGPYFPFLSPFWSDDRPAGFVGFEEIYGVLFMMPIHLAGLVAFGWALRNRAVAGTRAARYTLAAAFLASVFASVILFCWAWACSRFVDELVAGWLVATCVGMMVVFGSDGAHRPARPVRILTAAAACWTIACVWLASAEFRGFMKHTSPRIYGAVAHALDYPSQWWARGHGIRFGPADIVVRVPPSADAGETVLMASGRPQSANRLLLVRSEDGQVRLVLAENEHIVLSTPQFQAPGGRLRIRVTVPWLYPPPEHPYWDGVADPAVRTDLQTLFSVDWGSGAVSAHSTHSFDASGFEPQVRGQGADPRTPFVESVSPAAPVP
jgi:hypothetical protein